MAVTLIHRYLIREILTPSLLCLLVFTAVILMGRMVKLVDLVINKGVAPGDIALLLAAMAPSFLTITLPLAFLMGVMIGLGRLSADSETVAMKAAGLSLTRIAMPVFLLALVFSLLTGTIGLWGKSWGQRTFKAKIFELSQQKAAIGIQPRVFMDHFPGLLLYTNEIDSQSGEMSGLFVRETAAEQTSLIFARKGDVYSDLANEKVIIRLQEGVIHHQKHGSAGDYQLVHFSSYDIQPDLGTELQGTTGSDRHKGRRLKPKEMSLAELRRGIDENPYDRSTNTLRSELHQRLCSPLAPLLFALLGLPFSIQAQRSGRSGGFVIGLVIYLGYYTLWSLADTLTADAGVSPWLTFWPMHALLFSFGLYQLRQRSLEKDSKMVSLIEYGLLWLNRRRQSA
ncbi:MAG: LPS export ABC transporter permease LptF [Desulfuromonadales bacterium]|nr:LPS export ABC transporter permease LptF [Desulfuromonadales bacterium]